MTDKMLLPVQVNNLPAPFIFHPDGALRDKVRRSVGLGVTRVIAGAEWCHLIIDVKRPYVRTDNQLEKPHD